jgi:hypothetical protein
MELRGSHEPAISSFVVPITDHIRATMGTRGGDPHTHTRKILFSTNTESGQANTILAMALEALVRPRVEVHVGSFPILKRRVEGLSPKLKFHALDGVDLLKAWATQGLTEGSASHPPTRKNFAPYDRSLALLLTGWDGNRAFSPFFECGWYLTVPPWFNLYADI